MWNWPSTFVCLFVNIFLATIIHEYSANFITLFVCSKSSNLQILDISVKIPVIYRLKFKNKNYCSRPKFFLIHNSAILAQAINSVSAKTYVISFVLSALLIIHASLQYHYNYTFFMVKYITYFLHLSS